MIKKLMIFILLFSAISGIFASAFGETGYKADSSLWIRAVIHTLEKGNIEAVWQKGGEDATSAGDRVIWGYFYASPSDVNWGSLQNPDVFVKIWFDRSGRVDVNFFHVSVPDIEVWSDYPYNGTADQHGTLTLTQRYIRQYYTGDGQSGIEINAEDGNPAAGYFPAEKPSGSSIINDLRIAAVIKTLEKGNIEAVWSQGGKDTTAGGHTVVWGHFYASPSDVNWGSTENPDLFVKIWFDASGRVDVNFFHVSVPDIEVYSNLPYNGTYGKKGTAILKDRYIRHEYNTAFALQNLIVTAETPAAECKIPLSQTSFTGKDLIAWADYQNMESGKSYTFEWYSPEGKLAQKDTRTAVGTEIRGCSWIKIPMGRLEEYGSGTWTVKFYYDGRKYGEEQFAYIAGNSQSEFEIVNFVMTDTSPPAQCGSPVSRTNFDSTVSEVFAWVDYQNFEGGKDYEFRWYAPDGSLAMNIAGSRADFSNGCSYNSLSGKELGLHKSGQWTVEFCYDNRRVCEKATFYFNR